MSAAGKDGASPQSPAEAAAGTAEAAAPLLHGGLKLRHLQLLLALEDERKLQRAAQALSMSQPAASRMLGDIERIAGVRLFERLPRGLEANACGEALIRRARTMLAELGKAGSEIAALSAGQGGSVAVGAVTAPAVEALVASIEHARQRSPGLQVSVDVETSNVLVEMLLASRLDFIVARLPIAVDPAPFHYREIGEEEVCLLVRETHPLARREEIAPHDLRGHDWVLQPRGSLLRRSVEAMLRRHGLPAPACVISTRSVLMTLAVAARTDAVVPFSTPAAELLLPVGPFRRLPLSEPITIEPFGLITLRGRPLSPAAQALYAEVESRVAAGRTPTP